MNKIKVIVSNPGLGAHVRQTVRAYNNVGMLNFFFTTFVLSNSKLSNYIVNKFKLLRSKQFIEIHNYKVKRLILPEIIRLISSKLLSHKFTDRVWEWSELLFDSWVAKKINKNVGIFHGYEHASLMSLKKCKSLGVFSVYEQPSAHHLYLNQNVLKLLFESENYFKLNFKDLYDSNLSEKRNQRRDEELHSADIILCNSTYVKKTLISAGVPEIKIVIHPLGFPEVKEKSIVEKPKLRFIISGNLSYLKGTHHVLRVWKKHQNIFEKHELICIGTDTLSPDEWKSLPKNVFKKERMNSEDYLKELANSDVYILNTYSDGFGMVMSEAMSHGLAVIGTVNSAAIDIIEDRKTGRVIPISDEQALFEAMNWMINNPSELICMRKSALEYAKLHSWDNYRIELPKLILEKYNYYKGNA